MDTSANRTEKPVISEAERKGMLIRLGSAVAHEMVLSNMRSSIASTLQARRKRFGDLDLVHPTAAAVVKCAEASLVKSAR